MFNRFSHNVKRAAASQNATQKWHELLNIEVECDMLRELLDIMDELSMMINVITKQEVVARAFVKHVQKTLMPARSSIEERVKEMGLSSTSGNRETIVVLNDHPDSIQDSEYIMDSAQEVLEGLGGRVSELTGLKDAANKVSQSLQDLLSLKQQQVVFNLKF